MNIIVTGSDGFIGGHLCERLNKEGHHVLSLDKKSGCDLASDPYLSRKIGLFNPDIIHHLAATCSTSNSLVNPSVDFRDNVISAFNLIEGNRTRNIPVILTSTCKVEPGDDGAKTPYGLTKRMAEEIVEEYAASYGLKYIINRPGTIYGPGQQGSPESGWLGWFMQAKKEDKEVTIFGDGEQVRDPLYVDDYVDLLLDQTKRFELYQGRTYKVGGEEAVSLLETVGLLDLKHKFGEKRKGDAMVYVSDNKDISRVGGWKPKTKLKDGIKLTMEAL
ncbi:MAG: hypothetical protein DRP09_10965 [Candidatus Thorarchaeota archaeon]|nr:MAG: hypothetical protein DRP09_10965 [Candidatus Thorarchaeota archaeon]